MCTENICTEEEAVEVLQEDENVAEKVTFVPAEEIVSLANVEISAQSLKIVNLATEQLESLAQEIQEKREAIIDYGQAIQASMVNLKSITGSTEDEGVSPFEQSVVSYLRLLDGVLLEVQRELEQLVCHEGKLAMPTEFAEYADVFVENKIVALKRNIKNIQKHVRVSFSRYIHGFEGHARKLKNLEARLLYIAEHVKQQKMVQAQSE